MAAQLQHWIVTCTTCGDPAEHHCNTCGDILCSRCKDIHQRSNATSHHKVVPYSERIKPSKTAGQCSDHPGNQYLHWCRKCNKAVCSECVTSAEHEGHKFIKLATRVEEQRRIVKDEFYRYSKLLVQWEDSLKETQNQMKTYETDVDDLDKEITKQADEICRHVRALEVAKKKELQQMKSTHTQHLQDRKNDLVIGIKGIKQHIKEIEDKLRSEDVLLVDGTKDVAITKPPERDSLPLPIFTPGTLDSTSLETMLGKLAIEQKAMDESKATGSSQTKALVMPDENKSSRASANLLQLRDSRADGVRRLSLLPRATEILTIVTETTKIPYLACSDSGQIWARIGDRRLQLMERGEVMQTINLNFDIRDITTTPQGDLLVADHSNKCIKSVTKEGISRTFFTTKWEPSGICVLQNGDVMVSFHGEGRVIQYSVTGEVVRELDKSLFRNPYSVAQNKINQHIYVRVYSAVLVFDMNGRLQYKYTGSDGTGIDPEGVCTDQAGHVIITDWSNHRVYILDKDGRFLQYLLTKEQGLEYPYTIDTDNDGYVWVGLSPITPYTESKIKKLKYMN